MEGTREGLKTVLGIHFIEVNDFYDIRTNVNQICYLIYSACDHNKEEYLGVLKYIRMIGLVYRICLLSIQGRYEVGICIYFEEIEKEEIASIIEWIYREYSDWNVSEYTGETIQIKGIRIPKTKFHKNKLLLQGEILD